MLQTNCPHVTVLQQSTPAAWPSRDNLGQLSRSHWAQPTCDGPLSYRRKRHFQEKKKSLRSTQVHVNSSLLSLMRRCWVFFCYFLLFSFTPEARLHSVVAVWFRQWQSCETERGQIESALAVIRKMEESENEEPSRLLHEELQQSGDALQHLSYIFKEQFAQRCFHPVNDSICHQFFWSLWPF